MPELKPLYKLYKGLKANNYDVPDSYASFERTLCAPGNEGARNRRTIYNALKKQNFDVPDSYESFYRTLFKPVSRTTSIAIGSPMPQQTARPAAPARPQSARPAAKKPVQPAGKGTPMTAAQKQAAVQGVNNLVGNAAAGLQRTANQMDYARATGGLQAGTPRLGQQGTVVRRDAKGNVEKVAPALNQLPELDAQDVGATYLTAAGNEYTDRTQAENEQMQLTRQEKAREANQNREALLRRQRAEVVEKMMARGKELDQEALQFSWRDMPRGAGGAVHTWNSSSANGRFFDKTYKTYMAQLNQIDDALAAIEEGKKGRESDAWINSSSNWFTRAGKNLLAFGAGAMRGLNHAVGKVSTWDMGMTDNNTNMALLDAARNAKKKGFAHISAEEQRLLTLAAESRLAQEENKAHIGYGYQVGEITGESLPFMLEMRINPLSNTGNVAVKQLTKWALKHYGKEALKKASRKYAAMKIGARVLGDIAGSAGMAATTGQGRVTADALRRLTGDVKYKEDAEGNIVYDGTEGAEDSVLTAYLKAFGAQTIENHSEMVGEYFAPFLGKVGKLARKGMAKVGLDSVSRFIDTVGATNFSRMISDFERQTKWNGTIGEYAEEVVGNIENALLVGDNTLDTAEGTGVFNLEQNIVTFLGVGLMGAAISGAKTASYRGPKRRALNAMNEAGRAVDRAVAESPYWMDKWGGWRNTLLVGTAEEKTAALVDALSDKELPMGFRQAILDYAKAAQEYTGLCQMQRSRQEDGTQDPIAAAYDASYDKGYGTTDRDAMNSAKNRLWLQREAVARELGLESADQVDEAIGDPLEYIEAQRQAGKQPGELQTVIDYANAKSEWDGMVARVRDEIDDKVAAEHREIDRQVNPGDGMIHRATLKAKTVDGEDQQVYVVSGKVVMEEDGSGVDMTQSDESVVVREAKTGELSQVSPDALLRVDAVVDPAEEKQQAEQAISQEMARAAADDIDGTVAFAAGDEYTLRAEDGSEQTVRVVANEQGVVDNGDGTVNVTLDDKTVMQMDKSAIQRGVDAARRAQAATELAQEKAEETSEAPSDTATEAEEEQPTSDTLEQSPEEEGEAPAEAAPEEGKPETAAVPDYGVNDNFTMTLPDGTPVRGTVQGVTADGVEVWTETPVEGKRVQVLPREEFEGMLNRLEDADGNPVWSREDGLVAQQEEETPAATDEEQPEGTEEQEIAPEEEQAPTPEEQSASDEAQPASDEEQLAAPTADTESGTEETHTSVEGGTELSADANNNVSGTSNNNESALSRVPKNEKGEPVYEQTDAETAWDAIVEQTGGNGEMARTVADSMVADKEAALKKAQKAKPRKGGTVAEKIAAEQERLAAIEQAKRDLAHWQKIAGVEQQRKQAAAAEAERAKAENAQGESVGLSDNDAADLMSQMEANAAEMPQMELNPTNWEREFGEEGTVATPIGQVKMGENQIAKLFEKGRSEQFGMIKPTLEHPQVIIEVPSEAIDGNAERNSSLLFVKTFIGKNGKKIYYFKSVTVKKDGLEVSVSSHYDRAKRINEALKNGKLLYRFDGGAQTEHHPAGASVTTSQENEQGTSEGKGNQKSGTTQESETKNLSEQEALRGVPDWVEDTPVAARRRGYRRSNGARYDRQGELVDGDFKPVTEAKDGRGVAVGKAVEVKFSDRDKQAGRVVVMEAEQLQPSHQGGRANVLHFIPEAQPKARTDEASVLSSERIASHINPEEITSSVTAYTGAPTVNARGEVIQGNNRSAALKTMWTGHAAEGEKYKQYLMDHAAEFGLKAEDIAGMAHPVLVNMAAVDDERAVELGQYDVKDTESGGQERIKPRNAAMKMGADMQTFASMLLKSEDEDASFSQLVDRNGLDVLQWMQTKGYISATQYKSALNSRGDLTAEASNDLKGILYQSIFQNGSERLEEMFNALPVKAQRAILGTAYRDYDSPETERMVPEIQQSIMAYHELMQDEAFASAKNMKDAQMALMMWQRQYKMDDATGESYLPTEKYSNFALQLAAMYKVQTQRMVQGTFNHLYDLIQGTQEADLFNQDTLDNTPRTLVEAIKEALNIDYNGQQRSNVLAGRGATSQQREQGSPGDAAADGRGTPGDGRAEREGGTDTTDDNLSPKEGQSRQAVNIHDPRSMSDEEKQRRGEMLRDATAVEVAEGQIVSTAELSARKAAEKWWQDHVSAPAFYDTEAGEVEIGIESIKDSLAHRYGQAKLDAITSLVDGFENAVYLGSMQDFIRTRAKVVNHYFAYPIIYKGERCYVFCRAMQDENKNRLYVHEVFIGDKINKGNTLQTAASKPHGGIALYRDILANVLNRSTSGGKVTDNSESTQEKGSKSAENRGVRGDTKTKESSQEKKSGTAKREGDMLFFEQFKEDSPEDDVPEKKRAAMRKFAEKALSSKNAETEDYPTYSAKRSSVEIPANTLFQSERKWFGVRTETIAFHDDAHGCSYEFVANKDRKGYLMSVIVVKFHDFKGAEGTKSSQGQQEKGGKSAENRGVRGDRKTKERSQEKKSGTVKRDSEDVSLADVFEGTHYNPAADFADWSQWKPGDELEYNGYRSRFVGVDKEDGHVVGVVVEHLDDAGNAVGKETVPPLMFLEQYKRAEDIVDTQGTKSSQAQQEKGGKTATETNGKEEAAAANQDTPQETPEAMVPKVMLVYREDFQKGHEAMSALLDGFDREQLRAVAKMWWRSVEYLDDKKTKKSLDKNEYDRRRQLVDDIHSLLKAHGLVVVKGSRGVAVGDYLEGYHGDYKVISIKGNTLTAETADGEPNITSKRRVKFYMREDGLRQSKSDGKAGEVSAREAALRDALVETMRGSGMAVSMDAAEGQRVLDEANEKDARMSAKRKRALETASVSQEEEHQPTVVSSADGAKVLNNLDTTIDNYEKRAGRPKTFLGDVAEALGARRYGSGSEYATFETKNGKVVTIRLSNHNVTVSNFDYNGKDEGISIVVSAKKNEGITNDGNAHITEFFYDAIKLRRAEGKPLADIVRSIKQVLYSGEFHDPTGLAERQEVNGGDVRFFRTRDGEAYGFTVGGKVYIDPRIANSETPVHEYAHLWATALRKGNPKEWANVVELMKGTRVWDEVKARYPELQTDDEVADEVLATYSGREGAKRLRDEARKMMDGEGDVMEKAEAVSALARVREALRRFWKATADFLHIHYTSAEEVADRVMKDLLDGVDPRQWGVDEKSREMSFGERYDYDRYPLGRVEPNLAEKEVEVVEADADHGFMNYKEARTWAKEHVAKTYTGEETGGKGDVRISNGAVDKFMSQSAVDKSDTKDVHVAVLKVLPEVLRTSIDVETHPDFLKGEDGKRRAGNGINKDVLVHRCYGAVSIDGKPYRVKITLKENNRELDFPHIVHSYEATKIELLEGTWDDPRTSPSPNTNNSISAAKLLENVGMSYNPSEKVLDASEKRSKDIREANDKSMRFQFIGERGAAVADHTEEVNTRMENLRVAREMEVAQKDAKAIKQATSWERGADGKWRYEIEDIKYHPKGDAEYQKLRGKQPWSEELDALSDRLFDGEQLTEEEMARFDALAAEDNKFKADFLSREKNRLADWVENKELFAAYPELKNMEIVFTDQLPDGVSGYYAKKDNRMVVSTASEMDTESVIAHELQHAIQHIEGFARGGNTKAAMQYLADHKQDDVKIKQDLAYKLSEEKGLGLSKAEVDNLIGHLEYEDIDDNALQAQIDALCEKHHITEDQLEDIYPFGAAWHEAYRRIAGEVEARNVQSRMGLTPEERREKLASETEDVAREDQLFLYGDGGVEAMGSRTNKKMKRVGDQLEGLSMTVAQQAVADTYTGKKDNVSFTVMRADKQHRVMMRQGTDFRAGTKHSLYRHYETGVGVIVADDILRIPEIIEKGTLTSKQRGKTALSEYEYTVNGVTYTVLTEKKKSGEIFNDFYTNRKASISGTSKTPQGAHTDNTDASLRAKVERNSENAKELGEKDGVDGDLYRVVDDAATVERLDREPKVTAYRAMQVIDGRLYSPMAAKVDGRLTADNPMGVWTEAEETLLDFTPAQEAAMKALDASGKKGDVELVKGKLRYHKESAGGRGTLQFHLVKGDGTSLWAAYNPYIHSSLMMLNDQFTSAYKRPNIVVVEVEIPKSELTSGYRAARAKDAVGVAQWKAGPVAGQLPSEMGRKVILSRWSKVKRVVPYAEVADQVASILEAAEAKKGEKLRLPIDSFHPELRKALEARGFKFVAGANTQARVDKQGREQAAWDDRSDAEKEKAYKGATYMDDAAIKELNAMLGGEWIQREGDGAQSGANERGRMAARVQELAEKLHLTNIEVVMDGSTLTGKRSRAKGFYNRQSGKITIVVGNHSSMADVEQTVLHEAVAHYGLRELFGAHFDTFLDNVYTHAEQPIREKITALARRNGWNYRTATEEYLAQLAEDTDFAHANSGAGWKGWWTYVKQAFLDMLHKIGFKAYDGPALSDNELRYILWRSYENLKEPGRDRSILGEAEDVSRQMALKVGNYAEEEGAQAMTGEEQANIEAIKQKVADLFEKARTGEFKGKPERIGRLSEAGKAYLEKLSGVPFKQYVDFVLNPSDMNHIRADHYGENEKDKGNNIPLTDEDIQNIVEVLNQPDGILYGLEKKDGRKLFFFLKDAGNGLYNLTEVCSTKKGNLTAKSFFKSKKKGINQRVMEIEKSLLPTSVTYSGASLSSAAKIPNLLELNKQSSEKVESDGDVLFRDGDAVDYDKAQARARYEARVRSGMYQMQEALQDSMLGLKEAMDAVLQAEGKKGVWIEDVAGFENAYLGENRLSSVNQAECVEFARRVFQPLLDEVNRLAPTADERAELTDYMMAKHGLERNKVMAHRDAVRKAEKEVTTAVLKLAHVIANKHTEAKVKVKAQQKTMELQALLVGIVNGLPAADAQRWYSIRQKAIDTRYHNGHYTTAQHKAALHKLDTLYNEGLSAWYEEGFRQRDYAGLTALTELDDVADAEMEARQMVDDYERENDTTALWEKTKAVNAWTLQKTYDSGMISKKVYDEIQGMYDYYIPLRGFDETTSEEAYAYLQDKRSALNSPIKTAKGRKSKADDPLANMSSMAESAIMQGNRNVLVKQKFLNFVLNHPSDLVSVSDLWLRYDAAADEWKPVNTGDVAGTEALEEDDSAAEVERKMKDFEEAMEKLAAYEPDTYKRQKEHPEIPYRVVDSRDLKQHQVLVKRGGKDYVLTINGSPRAAQALNGQTNPDNDMTGAIGAILQGGEWLNRQLSALYTTRNPDFVVSNFMRDAIYANTMVWVKENPNYALRFHSNFAKVNPAKLHQLLVKQRKGTLDMTDQTERLFAEFMANGGETGYTSLKNLEQHKKAIEQALKMNDGKLTLRKGWDLLGERFEEVNRAVENCARFAAYVTSREMKRTIDRSVYDAKEISVNFNKKGAGSKFMDAVGQTKLGKTAAFTSGAGRSLYVFWNAALQGTTNFGRQVVRHPKKSLAGMATMLLLGALMAAMGGGDDDDDEKDTKDSYYNLPEYVRRSNIVFRLPGMKKQWISIPLPVEYRAIYGLGELMTSVLHGKEHFTAGEIASQLAGQISQVLPIDIMEGGGGWKAFVPSSVKPFAEVMTNKSWTGMPLYKDNDYNKADPEWTKAYKSANPYLVGTARWLNEVTGGDKYTAGLVDINPSQVEYLLNGYFGGVSNTIDKLTKTGETLLGSREYDPRSFLIVNRLVKNGDERTEQRAVNNEYFRLREEHDRTKKRLKGYEDDTDNGVMDYAEQIDFLYHSPEYARMQIYEDYAPDIDAISKELKEPMSDEERKKTEADLSELKREMVEEANKTRKSK